MATSKQKEGEENPPETTKEDDEILDEVWDHIDEES